MITEDYVSFETSKLLKEKGFDEKCLHYYEDNRHYDEDIKFSNWCNIEYSNSEIGRRFTCPTQAMAMKWLREVHNLHCCIDYDFVLGWYCQITSLKETVEYDNLEMKHYHLNKDNSFSSPEEACEAAIKYCLEHLI